MTKYFYDNMNADSYVYRLPNFPLIFQMWWKFNFFVVRMFLFTPID